MTPNYEQIALFLYRLLDDIDTADDIAKGDEKFYRSLVRNHMRQRFLVAETDGYTVTFRDVPDGERVCHCGLVESRHKEETHPFVAKGLALEEPTE